MVISKFSKDGKRGFSVGSNSLTPEKVVAGAVTAFSALIIMLIGGIFKLFIKDSKSSAKEGKKSKNDKGKKSLLLLALPAIYKQVKSRVHISDTKVLLSGLVEKYSADSQEEAEEPDEDDTDIEVIDAIPIESEDEVYEHI